MGPGQQMEATNCSTSVMAGLLKCQSVAVAATSRRREGDVLSLPFQVFDPHVPSDNGVSEHLYLSYGCVATV